MYYSHRRVIFIISFGLLYHGVVCVLCNKKDFVRTIVVGGAV